MQQTSLNDTCRLYKDLAWTWPIISPKEDYIKEAEEFVSAIREYSRIEPETLLDLGCGGGHNDWALKKYFKVVGVDISKAMLELAKALNPEVSYSIGDMRTVRLNRTFDAVMIADSISHMQTENDLQAAFTTAFEHLEPGGVFLTLAEYTRERFKQNYTSVSTHTSDDIEITLIENAYDPDPADMTLESTMVYLIRRDGKLTIEIDRFVPGLFPLETWIRLLKKVGFDVNQMEFEEGACPMFVCIKPS